MLHIANHQTRSYIRNNAGREVDTACRIQWNRNDTAQYAAEKRCDPLSGVCTPKQNAFAGRDAAIRQQPGEAARQRCQFGIRSGYTPIAGIADDSDLFAVPLKIFDESGEMLPHDKYGCSCLAGTFLRATAVSYWERRWQWDALERGRHGDAKPRVLPGAEPPAQSLLRETEYVRPLPSPCHPPSSIRNPPPEATKQSRRTGPPVDPAQNFLGRCRSRRAAAGQILQRRQFHARH